MNTRAKVTMPVALVEADVLAWGKAPAIEAKAAEYRRKAQAHAREAARSKSRGTRDLQLRLVLSYLALAENEEWLDGKTAPTLTAGV